MKDIKEYLARQYKESANKMVEAELKDAVHTSCYEHGRVVQIRRVWEELGYDLEELKNIWTR